MIFGRVFDKAGSGSETLICTMYTDKKLNFSLFSDHFTFTTDAKFPQKYLYNDTWWDKEKSSLSYLKSL